MLPLTVDDLLPLEEYANRRREFFEKHARYVDRYRRVRIGPHLTLIFENRQTLWFRVQEIIRIARLSDAGVLQHIDARDQADAMPVSVVAQTTPSPGTEANFFQELFGNIGRFVPVASGPSGGGGAPAPAQ